MLLCISISRPFFRPKTTGAFRSQTYVSENKKRLGITDADIESLFVTYDYTDASTGIQHIYSLQKLNGLTITGSDYSLHLAGDKKADANRLLSLSSFKTSPVITAVDAKAAVLQLMAAINYTQPNTFTVKHAATGADKITIFSRNTSSVWDIPVRLVYYNDARLKQLTSAWEVQMMDVNKQHYWLGYIDAASGKSLEKKDLILHWDFGNGGVTDARLSLTDNNIAGGGWWIDDVYIMTNRTQVVNRATAVSVTGITPLYGEGTNAYDTTSAFIIGTANANLTADKADNSVQLQWNTTNETGAPQFAIMRKTAADADFVTIDTYTPTEEEVTSGHYSYKDNSAATGNVEYSVKQMSEKSTSYVSNIAMIKVGNSLQATLYPNPVSTNATLQIVNKNKEEATITLYDIHGRKLATLNSGTDSRTVTLPVQGLSNSTYYVEIRTKSESLTLPMVVRKWVVNGE